MISGVIAVVIVSGLFVYYKLQYSGERQYNPHSQPKSAYYVCFELPPPLISFCPSEKRSTQSEAQRADDDLAAQQEMADWAFVVALTSAAGLCLSLVGLFLIYATFKKTGESVSEARNATKAARDAVDATREIGQAENRAYLAVTDGTYKVDADYLIVDFELFNSGQTPARFVAYTARLATFRSVANDTGETVPRLIHVEDSEHALGQIIAANTPEPSRAYWKKEQFTPDDYQFLSREHQQITIMIDLRWTDVFKDIQESAFQLMVDRGEVVKGTKRGVKEGRLRATHLGTKEAGKHTRTQ